VQSHNPSLDNLELVKCKNCGWVHFLVDEKGNGCCFLCSGKDFEKATEYDAPYGSTIQSLIRDKINITKEK